MALASTTLNVARGQILGEWQVGNDEDDFTFSKSLN